MIDKINENYSKIFNEIIKTCKKVNRAPESIRIVAVSKGRSYKFIEQAIKIGIKDIGENRVKEAIEKFSLINKNIIKHFIGHLQKNKVNKVLENFDIIQSIDSFELIDKVDNYLSKKGIAKKYPVLIQVNISGESQKSGIDLKDADDLIKYVKNKEYIELCGLMGISGLGSKTDEIRKQFRELKKINNRFDLKELSIGMSNDYTIAIEEGSTIVRIGTKLFEGV